MPISAALALFLSVANHTPVTPQATTEAATPSQALHSETYPEAVVVPVSCNPSIQRCY